MTVRTRACRTASSEETSSGCSGWTGEPVSYAPRAGYPAKRDPPHPYDLLIEVRDHGQPPLSSSASINVVLVDSIVEGRSGDRGSVKSKEGSLDLTLILIIALGSVSFIFLLAMIVLAVRCQKEKKLNIYTCMPETRAVSAAVAKRAGARRSSVNRTSCSSRALTWPVPHRCRWRSQAASARTTRTRTTATRCA